MKYCDIKQALYNSDVMEELPDSWKISVPFLCRIKKNTYDAFACTVERENARLMKLLLVDSMTGKVDTLEPEEVVDLFGLDTLSCPAEPIGDYDRYLADKDQYEQLYDENHSDLIRDIPIDNATAAKIGKLLVQSVGKVLFQKVVSKVADQFLNQLSQKVRELKEEKQEEQPVEEQEEPIENSAAPKE